MSKANSPRGDAFEKSAKKTTHRVQVHIEHRDAKDSDPRAFVRLDSLVARSRRCVGLYYKRGRSLTDA